MIRVTATAVGRSFVSAAIFLLATVGLQAAEASPLRAGVARHNITADTPQVPVYDPLFAKAFVVDDGQTRAAIVCLDMIVTPRPLVVDLRRRIENELGIPGENVLVNASHNHNTYDQIATDIADRIVLAVKKASETMVPVRVGAGSGREDRITMNRRLRLTDGKEWTIRRATPSPRDADVAGIRPFDAEIGVLRVDTMSGRNLAIIYNFAGHAYGGVPGGGVTADFPGFASGVIEETTGGTAFFLQGAAGDITPIRYKDFDAPPPTEFLGTRLGMSTLNAAQRIVANDAATLRVASDSVELPRRTDTESQIRSLELQQDEILDFFTGIGCGAHGAGTALNFKSFLPLYLKQKIDPEHPAYAAYLYQQESAAGQNGLEQMDADNRTRVDKYSQCIDKMEKLIHIRANLQILKARLAKSAEGPISIEVQGIRIGDFAVVTFPGDLFSEVAMRLKQRSPMSHTFVAGYSNGSIGYAPTAEAYQGQAYEDCLSELAPEWQVIYESKAMQIIQRLSDK